MRTAGQSNVRVAEEGVVRATREYAGEGVVRGDEE